jgi:hypothetical protein
VVVPLPGVALETGPLLTGLEESCGR